MEIAGIDLDSIWETFNTATKAVSNFIVENAQRINFVALGILSLIATSYEPIGYLVGFVISWSIGTADIALGNKISDFFSRFLPTDPVQKLSLLATLGMITQTLIPPLFSFGLGIFSGRKCAEITISLIQRFKPA
jgi:hypothetical protein